MGTGKSQAAITYMNEHPEKRFVYITPYLSEGERIKNGCPDLNFKLPKSGFIGGSPRGKVDDTMVLIMDGENIATTHSAFSFYDRDIADAIKRRHYTLIIDEALDVFTGRKYRGADIDFLIDTGCLEESGRYISIGSSCDVNKMRDTKYWDVVKLASANNLIRSENTSKNAKNDTLYYWVMSPSALKSFDDIFVLTYMFDASDLKTMFDMYDIEYDYIGVSFDGQTHRFSECEAEWYVPEYTKTLNERVFIVKDRDLNDIGDRKNAISVNWLSADKRRRGALRDRQEAFLRRYGTGERDVDIQDLMWSTYKQRQRGVAPRGFIQQVTPFNMKAKNEYSGRHLLSYCVNLYPNPSKSIMLASCGVSEDVDRAALSTMVQWVWRSAIRNGECITVYIPSFRMREMLYKWVASVSGTEPQSMTRDIVGRGYDGEYIKSNKKSIGKEIIA